MWITKQLPEISAPTLGAIFRSRLKCLNISSSTIKITFDNDEDGTRVMVIRESGRLSNIWQLIDATITSSPCFRISHALDDGTSEFELTCRNNGKEMREIELCSSTWTNENFKSFADRLGSSHFCSSLKVDADKVVASLDILTSISSQFPYLKRLELIVSKCSQSHVSLLLAMRQLVHIKVIVHYRDPVTAIPPDELEGFAAIEEMERAAGTLARVIPAVLHYESTSRPYLVFDVPEYDADAVFFFFLSMRNPYLEKIDIRMANFYGRNLAPLQELKHLKEVRLCISSTMTMAVEMVGSLLTGFKNESLLFELKTNRMRNEVVAEIHGHKLTKISITQEMDWESTQSNNWPRLLSQFSSLVELELNGVCFGHNVICKNRRLRNLTWDKLDDDALISFSENLPSLECVSCFDSTNVTTSGLLTLMRGKARHCLRRIDVPLSGRNLDAKILTEEVRTIQKDTNRKLLLFIGM